MALTMKNLAALLVIFYSLSMPLFIFSLGNKEGAAEVTLQDQYNSLVAPGVVMLPISGTSAVSSDILEGIEQELFRQLVHHGKLKPIRMQQWLMTTYTNKANNPFVIMNAIRNGRYNFPLNYIGKPYVFKSGKQYYFTLSFYSLSSSYPITVFTQITDLEMLGDMIASCIDELFTRFAQPEPKKAVRIIVDDFKLEFLRLVELSSGEFEFISAPFIEKEDVTLREGDDFFSRVMGYILATTNLFQVIYAGDFKEYSNTSINAAATRVDYRMRGRVQLSENECVLYVDVINISTGAKKISLRYPILSYSFEEIWSVYRQISVQIIESLLDKDSYSFVPELVSDGKCFFVNDMFVGWDTLENFALAKGLHVIYTGTPYRLDNKNDKSRSENSYYIFLDNHTMIFNGREGRRIWNLLAK